MKQVLLGYMILAAAGNILDLFTNLPLCKSCCGSTKIDPEGTYFSNETESLIFLNFQFFLLKFILDLF